MKAERSLKENKHGSGSSARSAWAAERSREAFEATPHFRPLREGLAYDEIAVEEGVTATRIRQIVSEVLQKRAVDSGADHAKLQLDRLAPAVQRAAEAIAAGDISAISPYSRRPARSLQSVAVAHHGYDDEDRKRLMDKINRVAANLGVDEMWNAAGECLKKHGLFPADLAALADAEAIEGPVGFDETEAREGPAGAGEEPQEGQSDALNWMSV